LVVRANRFGRVRTDAGADIALSGNTGYAAVIVYSFPEMQEKERAWCAGELTFPYVPGLLSFREIPLLLQAFAKLKRQPDLVLADGQGWAHPRRAGLACHLGLLLGLPTIGCAKSLLVGTYGDLGLERGSVTPLFDGKDRIGTVLRTRDGVKPVFVSCGHRVSLAASVRFVLRCCDGYRIPKPQREADRWVKQLKRSI
jgi:deoxyribonuclease V